MKSLNEQPGRIALTKYRVHGGGVELFRAYVQRREADKQVNRQRRELFEGRLPTPNKGVSHKEFDEAATELLWMDILDELDPIIQDLLKFCEKQIPVDDQLPNLRSALRIGKGYAPSDSLLPETRWRIEQRWVDAYLKMSRDGEYFSETKIKADIASCEGVSESTALNHWKALKKREPWQAKWATEISVLAKTAGKKREASENGAVKKRSAKKIVFGKGSVKQ